MSSNISAPLVPTLFNPLALLPPPLGEQIMISNYVGLAALMVSLEKVTWRTAELMISVGMHMGLATVDSRRDSDVSPKKAPSAHSFVFLLSVSTGSPSFCKGHCNTTPLEPGHLYFPQFHLWPVVRSPASLTDVPY
jgi:hypothetical protein